MKAVTYQGANSIEVKNVDDAKIEKKDDIIVRITSTSICGSDLHLYQENFPLPKGYIIGHEPMGIVEEVGSEVARMKKGDRVVIPIMIREAISDILRSSAITPAVKRNTFKCLLAILRRSLSPRPASLKMSRFYSCLMCFRQPIGVWNMQVSKQAIP